MKGALAGAALALLAGRAAADPPAATPPAESGELPSPFITLDHLFDGSVVQLDGIYGVPRAGQSPALRAELSAEYLDPRTHAGAYIAAPLAYVGVGAASASTTFGGVELGGVYAIRPAEELAIVLHAGLVHCDIPGSAVTAQRFAALVARPRDVGMDISGWTLRLGASPTLRAGNLFARVDVALDLNLTNTTGPVSEQVATLGAGIGIQEPGFVLAAELSYTHVFDSAEDSSPASAPAPPSRDNPTLAALSVRLAGRYVQPYVAAASPIDPAMRAVYLFSITVGVAGTLR